MSPTCASCRRLKRPFSPDLILPFAYSCLLFASKQELNSLFNVLQAFIFGLAWSIGPWHFQASRPKTAFVRLALMNDRRELFHVHNLTSFPSAFKPIFQSCQRHIAYFAGIRQTFNMSVREIKEAIQQLTLAGNYLLCPRSQSETWSWFMIS
jgi:hypothetical protein